MEKFKSVSHETEKSLESSNLGGGKKSLELSVSGQKIVFLWAKTLQPTIS